MIRNLLILLLLSNYCFAQQTNSFKNGELELFYEEHGKGPALYILTGGPGMPPYNPSYLLIDSLKSHYTCVLLHQRATGKSKNIPINKKTITIKNYIQDIELLRQARKDKKFSILGISWGGLLAMNYTAAYPQYISNLVLLCSAPPSYKLWNVLFDNQFARRSLTEIDSLQALFKIFSVKTAHELDSLKNIEPLGNQALAFKHFLAIHVRSMYYTRVQQPANFDKFFRDFNFQPIPLIDEEVMNTKWDITSMLKKLNTPALILYGRQDDQGESTFYLQKECLKNSKMEVIEQCGHIMWEDQPKEFFRKLLDYLIPGRK